MCKVFKIDVLAEGVEDLKEVDCLLAMGCSSFQGFVFARPMLKEHIAELMNIESASNVKLPLTKRSAIITND